jgi:hypothetical protein
MVHASASDAACPACGVPLSRVAAVRLTLDSRRAFDRVPRDMTLTVRVSTSRDVHRDAVASDVSLSGMRLRITGAVTVGDRIAIDCVFCAAVAVVRSVKAPHHRSGALDCGVEFLTLRVKQERGGLVSVSA